MRARSRGVKQVHLHNEDLFYSRPMQQKQIIGRAEFAWLVDKGVKRVPARIDTGARTSSIWASNIRETGQGLEYCLFGDSSPLYSGEVVAERRFTKTVVASSNGSTETRYKVPIVLQMRGRRIKTFCTLADRSLQAYPLLVGRNTLRGKFIVDVQKGSFVLDRLEDARSDELQSRNEDK